MANSEIILALGKNLGIGSNRKDIRRSPDFLSPESRIIADAAAYLFLARRGKADIRCHGGHTAGNHLPAESIAMKMRILKYFDIPPAQIITESVSYDTRSNAIETAGWLKDNPQYTKINLLTVGFHAKNSAILMRHQSVPIDEVFSAEDIVSEQSIEGEITMNIWRDEPRIRAEIFKEGFRSLLLNTVDPTGERLQAVAEFART